VAIQVKGLEAVLAQKPQDLPGDRIGMQFD
jgi:hypothetical protein